MFELTNANARQASNVAATTSQKSSVYFYARNTGSSQY